MLLGVNGAEIVGTFYEKELQKTKQIEFIFEKVITRKGDKLILHKTNYFPEPYTIA